MVRPVHFTYRIERDTRRPVAVAASAYRMPLDTPADYARAALAETAGDLYDAGDALGGERRVLLDHVQYFAFLAEITARIRDAVHPEARVFIEVCAPYFGALPAELLAPHVLLGVHLYDEALRDAARGAPSCGSATGSCATRSSPATTACAARSGPRGSPTPSTRNCAAHGRRMRSASTRTRPPRVPPPRRLPIPPIIPAPRGRGDLEMTDTLTVMQDTADIRWSMPVDALMSNDYALREEALNRLYERRRPRNGTSRPMSTGATTSIRRTRSACPTRRC